MPEVVVRRDPVDVMFTTVPDDQDGITRGSAQVEEAVPLRGRKFYGAVDINAHEYRVCVQIKEGDDPAALGLERGTLAGGRYARVRLEGQPPAVYAEIAPAFERLAQRPDHDPTRPTLGYYSREDVMTCCCRCADSWAPCTPSGLEQIACGLLHLCRVNRRADPYRDTDLIDARAPRFNQFAVGSVAAVAVAFGPWWLLALLALQLALGLTLGRRWCLACVFYFDVVQPRFGEGPLEDSRPPRFANMVGLAFLGAGSLAYLVGVDVVGAVLGGIVAALALLAAATGFCAGCTAYKIGYRLTGRRFVSCPLPPRPGEQQPA